jgi:LPS-assembly lipoprotein
MWWHERRKAIARVARPALVLTLSCLLAGCFEPVYGERTLSGGPGMRQRLSAVDVASINAPSASPEARIAVALRNALIFEFTGGSDAATPTHRLTVQIAANRQQVIVDITTARPDVELVGFSASYSLTEIATGKVVVTGSTYARASYDIPGQQQRFAGARGQLDAQERTVKVMAENIRSRLASYFLAGT